MDIEKFLPNQSENWYCKYNTIYYKKTGAIPILKSIDGTIFVSFDRRVTRHCIKIIQKLHSLDQSFLLCDRITITEKHIYKQDLGRIIDNYLYSISDPVFFKFLTDSDFDFINNIISFLDTYDIHSLFKKRYDYLKKHHFQRQWTDWYTMKIFWTVKDENIRDYYNLLERQIKLSIFFT